MIYTHTRDCLVGYFGADKPLDEITPGDADDWRRWLVRAEDETDAKGGGYGLVGMRERAELIGGTLETGPEGRGFRVALRVPA